MTIRRLRFVLLVPCFFLTATAFAWQEKGSGAKRLYVEPFATRAGAETLREDVTAELRKLHSVSLVPDESNADFILGGGGEIWVKGYRSFSPRSHMKLPTNGMPMYAGFLSLELKNKQGVTLWSYLATPPSGSEDLSKDISKRIAKNLAEALNQRELPRPASPPSQAPITLKGAGATFPYPVYSKWFTNYRVDNPNVEITYDAVGSEAGIRRLLAGDADFGGSDSPQAIHEIAPSAEKDYLFFPSVVGAVVPIVNLPGVAEQINFTPEALAGIYLGRIKKWNDPILKRSNHGVNLPDLDIVVVHRTDGSGTTYAWTDYLSQTSADWRSTVGVSLAPKWPTGRGANGSDGVAKLVKELGGSIGYVEFIYALQNHLGYGRVRNQHGDYVEAGLESIAAAAAHSMELRDDFKSSIVDAPGEGSYPIASFTWIVVPAHIADDAQRIALTSFLRWMLGPGQRQAAALGYVAVPRDIMAREENSIANVR